MFFRSAAQPARPTVEAPYNLPDRYNFVLAGNDAPTCLRCSRGNYTSSG